MINKVFLITRIASMTNWLFNLIRLLVLIVTLYLKKKCFLSFLFLWKKGLVCMKEY